MLDMAGSCVTQEHQILCLASVGQLFQLAVRNLKYDRYQLHGKSFVKLWLARRKTKLGESHIQTL